jgi:hypothetical protein
MELFSPKPTEYMYHRAPEDICNDQTIFSYLYDTFNAIKFSIDAQIIKKLTNYTIEKSLIDILPYSCPAYEMDDMMGTFNFFTPLLISITFMFTSLIMIGDIVHEKQTQVKEYLKLIGCTWHAMHVARFIRTMIIYTILSIFITGVFKITFKPSIDFPIFVDKNIMKNADVTVIFSILFIYSFQVTGFTLLISQLFSRRN